MHGLVFRRSIHYWQDQPGIRGGAGAGGRGGGGVTEEGRAGGKAKKPPAGRTQIAHPTTAAQPLRLLVGTWTGKLAGKLRARLEGQAPEETQASPDATLVRVPAAFQRAYTPLPAFDRVGGDESPPVSRSTHESPFVGVISSWTNERWAATDVVIARGASPPRVHPDLPAPRSLGPWTRGGPRSRQPRLNVTGTRPWR